nr:30S ribosomal protein S11 [Blattabacterium sp.]
MVKSSLRDHKKKSVLVDPVGEAHIQATFNNIIITLTNKKGDVVAWSSAGKMNFRGSKKNTPYAAQIVAENVAKKGLNAGIKKVEVKIKGPGSGRDAAIRALSNSGITVTIIKDITPLPHNGCRPPKRRRV